VYNLHAHRIDITDFIYIVIVDYLFELGICAIPAGFGLTLVKSLHSK
jgi:hypothetical protein